jgi:hypothetical protein
MRTRSQQRSQQQPVASMPTSSSTGFTPSSVDVPLTDEMLGTELEANRQNFSMDSPVAHWFSSPGQVMEDRSLLVEHINVLLKREVSDNYGSLAPYSDCKYAWAGYQERCRTTTSTSVSSSSSAAVPANGSTQSSSSSTSTAGQPPSLPKKMEEGWRRKICEWMFEVVDHYKFDREVVSIALFYLDRFVTHNMNAGEAMGRREFQLLAICCLYTAMKVRF